MPNYKIITTLIVSSLLLTLTSPVLAEDTTITTTAIPPRLELSASPGETLQTELRIRNESSSTQYYSVSVDDFIVSDLQGTPIPVKEDVSNRWSLKSWISSPDYIPVDSKQTQSIKLTIKVPSNALPGGHYAMITYQPNPDAKPGQMNRTGSLIGQRTGSLLYVTVKGPISLGATLTRFFTSKFHEFGPINFEGIVANTSDIHINPKGEIIIKDFLNHQVAILPVETGNIFPQVSRSFTTTWNQKWGYGRYSADLSLPYGDTGAVIVGTIFFWFFPIRLVIYTLTLIIAILFVIITLTKRNKRHQQELEAEVEALKQELDKAEK